MNPSKLKMPSTPDVEFLPDFNTPEKEFELNPKVIHPIFKHHQQHLASLPPATPDTPESRKVSIYLKKK